MQISIKNICFSSFLIILSLFSFTTLTYSFYPIVNRILGFFIIILMVIIYIFTLKKKDVLIILAILLVDIFGMKCQYDFDKGLNDMIYFTITLLTFWKLADSDFIKYLKVSFNRINKILWFIVTINAFMITIGFFMDSCYSTVWFGRYYLFFSYSQHTLACACCINLSVLLILYNTLKNDFIKIILFLPFTYAILQSGARTYLISVIVFLFLLYKDSLSNKRLKNIFLPLTIILFVIVFISSGMMEKMLFTSSDIYTSNDSAISFSSGRFEFWLIDLDAYSKSKFINKIFGNGFDYVYLINKNEYGFEIWAHNDFINVLLCNGIIGVTIYVFILIYSITDVRFYTSKLNMFLLFIYIVGVAFFNGLFEYQHYLYSVIFLTLYLKFSSNNVIISNPIVDNSCLGGNTNE